MLALIQIRSRLLVRLQLLEAFPFALRALLKNFVTSCQPLRHLGVAYSVHPGGNLLDVNLFLESGSQATAAFSYRCIPTVFRKKSRRRSI